MSADNVELVRLSIQPLSIGTIIKPNREKVEDAIKEEKIQKVVRTVYLIARANLLRVAPLRNHDKITNLT